MSQCILCKGHKPNDLQCGIVAVSLDEFLNEMALRIWGDVNDVWSISINHRDIDYYLTKAQREIIDGMDFEETEVYNIISELLNKELKIAMWYDTYCDDLPLCKNAMEAISLCYEGIVDESGMCEVYFLTD